MIELNVMELIPVRRVGGHYEYVWHKQYYTSCSIKEVLSNLPSGSYAEETYEGQEYTVYHSVHPSEIDDDYELDESYDPYFD